MKMWKRRAREKMISESCILSLQKASTAGWMRQAKMSAAKLFDLLILFVFSSQGRELMRAMQNHASKLTKLIQLADEFIAIQSEISLLENPAAVFLPSSISIQFRKFSALKQPKVLNSTSANFFRHVAPASVSETIAIARLTPPKEMSFVKQKTQSSELVSLYLPICRDEWTRSRVRRNRRRKEAEKCVMRHEIKTNYPNISSASFFLRENVKTFRTHFRSREQRLGLGVGAHPEQRQRHRSMNGDEILQASACHSRERHENIICVLGFRLHPSVDNNRSALDKFPWLQLTSTKEVLFFCSFDTRAHSWARRSTKETLLPGSGGGECGTTSM